jgi:hypothetical protein
MTDKVNCFLEINGLKNSFWVDSKCTPNRIKRCLNEYQGMIPQYTKLYLNENELTIEKPIVEQGLKSGDIINVKTDENIQSINNLINPSKKIVEKIFSEKECIVCLKELSGVVPIYVPCGHRNTCYDCYQKYFKCSICYSK